MDNQTASAKVIPFQSIDYASALALTQSRDVMDDLFLDLCGLRRAKMGDKIVLQRISKPIFTPMYANQLTNFLSVAINRITARTTFRSDQVDNLCRAFARSLRYEMSTNGFRHLISDGVWSKLLAKSVNGDFVDWTYDDQVTDSMIVLCRQEANLSNESFGQDVIMLAIYNHLLTFYMGAINRSKDALTLNHEKVVHQERIVTNNSPDYKSDESAVDKVKRGVKNLFGL